MTSFEEEFTLTLQAGMPAMVAHLGAAMLIQWLQSDEVKDHLAEQVWMLLNIVGPEETGLSEEQAIVQTVLSSLVRLVPWASSTDSPDTP